MRQSKVSNILAIFGTLFSGIGIVWTHITYTREARIAEALAIAQMSEALVGMQMDCDNAWLALNQLTWEKTLRARREQHILELQRLINSTIKAIEAATDQNIKRQKDKERIELQQQVDDEQDTLRDEELKERCFASYRKSRQMVFSASTIIQKPWYKCSTSWENAWNKFKDSLKKAGESTYSQEDISKNWQAILTQKRIFIVDAKFPEERKDKANGEKNK